MRSVFEDTRSFDDAHAVLEEMQMITQESLQMHQPDGGNNYGSQPPYRRRLDPTMSPMAGYDEYAHDFENSGDVIQTMSNSFPELFGPNAGSGSGLVVDMAFLDVKILGLLETSEYYELVELYGFDCVYSTLQDYFQTLEIVCKTSSNRLPLKGGQQLECDLPYVDRLQSYNQAMMDGSVGGPAGPGGPGGFSQEGQDQYELYEVREEYTPDGHTCKFPGLNHWCERMPLVWMEGMALYENGDVHVPVTTPQYVHLWACRRVQQSAVRNRQLRVVPMYRGLGTCVLKRAR